MGNRFQRDADAFVLTAESLEHMIWAVWSAPTPRPLYRRVHLDGKAYLIPL